MQSIDKNKKPILIYDSECTLCNRFKQSLERLPHSENLQMVSIHNEEIYQLFPKLSKIECNDQVHLIDEDDNILVAGEVVRYLIRFFPGVKNFAWLIDNGMGKKVVDIFYKAVSEYRKSSLNNCKNCK